MRKLDNFRKEIDKINLQIMGLLKKRIKISKEIGKYKKQNGLSILDAKREQKIYNKLKIYADEKGLDRKFVEDLFKLIIKQSRKEQK